jgi:hypothetical protein
VLGGEGGAVAREGGAVPFLGQSGWEDGEGVGELLVLGVSMLCMYVCTYLRRGEMCVVWYGMVWYG